MKITKRLLALALILVLALSLTGCASNGTSTSMYGTTTTKVTAAALEISEEEQNPEASAYTNDYDGLAQYLKASEIIAGDPLEMSADYIGAVKGGKYTYKYDGTTITCELYEFDTANLSEKATETINSVKENGTFKSLDNDVAAVLSTSEKFLMVYRNSNTKDENQVKLSERTLEKFTNFVGK